MVTVFFRNFLESKWGMEEFMMADAETLNRRRNFIILVLKDKMNTNELAREIRKYVRTYTYIDATKNTNEVIERLR